MVTHMKTTIEISDPLLEKARRVAAREGTTVRALVERGLRRVVEEGTPRRAFRLRKASFKGRGLRPEAAELGWRRVRELAYEGRGG
jgi:tRNA(Ile2) C34 agmatinyltransferase TiaS